MSLFVLLVACIEIVYVYMSPQIKNSNFGLYKYFKVASNPLRNRLKSPDGGLYKLNIIKLHVLVSSLTAIFPNPFLYSDVQYQFS
jgi:hypothetical protein